MARDFDAASNQYLANNNVPVATTPLTMACWFNSRSATAQQFLMALADYSGGEGGDFHALVAEGSVAGDPLRAASFVTNEGTVFSSSSSGYTTDTWHHGAGVWSAADNRLVYLDGVAGTANTDSRSVAGLTRAGIGTLHRSDNPNVYVDGLIAEAAMWSAALTDAEVAILAQGVTPLRVRPQSLVAYWPLIGRYSPEIDPVGGFDMTLNNGPTVAEHPRVLYGGAPLVE